MSASPDVSARGASSPLELGARLRERPALASKARLRLDRRTRRCWLLYPERGLLLEGSAEALLRECDGRRTLSEVLEHAAAAHGVSPGEIVKDATEFLAELTARGLIVWK